MYAYHALCCTLILTCTFMLSVYTWGHFLTYVYTSQWRPRIRGIGALQNRPYWMAKVVLAWDSFPAGFCNSSGKRLEEIDISLVGSQLLNYISLVDAQEYTLMTSSLRKSVQLIGLTVSISSSHPVRWEITPSAPRKTLVEDCIVLR